MDYLGWELERQRAALRALLGGGEPEEEAPREAAPRWDGEAAPEETEGSPGRTGRSPERPGRAWRRAPRIRRAGPSAGGRDQAGGSPEGALGAWEAARAADQAAPGSRDGGPAEPVSAWEEFLGGEAEAPVREERIAGAEASPAGPRQRAPAESRRTLRSGADGPAAERPGLSGRRRAGTGMEAAEPPADPGRTAEAAGRRPAEDGPAAGGEAPLEDRGREAAGAYPGEHPGAYPGGGPRSAASASRSYGGGMTPPGARGPAGTAGQGERLSRSLPWGEGWESPALRAEAGARTLSRAVQRDARRYDGGFAIY